MSWHPSVNLSHTSFKQKIWEWIHKFLLVELQCLWNTSVSEIFVSLELKLKRFSKCFPGRSNGGRSAKWVAFYFDCSVRCRCTKAAILKHCFGFSNRFRLQSTHCRECILRPSNIASKRRQTPHRPLRWDSQLPQFDFCLRREQSREICHQIQNIYLHNLFVQNIYKKSIKI